MDGAKSLNEMTSPLRVLAAFFQKSRDRWKKKCADAKVERKRFQVRAADVAKSRDAWRSKAEASQQELLAMQAQVQQLQQQLVSETSPKQK